LKSPQWVKKKIPRVEPEASKEDASSSGFLSFVFDERPSFVDMEGSSSVFFCHGYEFCI
jgi:hypothetical protein